MIFSEDCGPRSCGTSLYRMRLTRSSEFDCKIPAYHILVVKVEAWPRGILHWKITNVRHMQFSDMLNPGTPSSVPKLMPSVASRTQNFTAECCAAIDGTSRRRMSCGYLGICARLWRCTSSIGNGTSVMWIFLDGGSGGGIVLGCTEANRS